MACYMVTYQLSGANRNEAIKRFTEGSAMQAPQGAKDLGRWHAANGHTGWAVVETDDPKIIADWLLHWTDIMSYEVEPVIGDEEFGSLVQKHGLG
jgi:hypothetical protein